MSLEFTHGICLLEGDVLKQLKTIPDNTVHCVVTSPPYYGLRDYGGLKQQIGLEETLAAFVKKLVNVFREVRRVLRPDGTCWVNMGDSYATKPMTDDSDFKAKDRMGIPHRLVFALQADGWYWRDEVIWHKPAPMPESAGDRTTKAHEYIFLLTKRPKYFFDNYAIREPVTGNAHSRGAGVTPKSNANAFGNKNNDSFASAVVDITEDRNKRSVWTVNTVSYPGAHFAVYPPKLIEPCILAGTSEEGCCADCGAPWKRIVKRDRVATRSGTDTKTTGDTMVDGNRDPLRQPTAGRPLASVKPQRSNRPLCLIRSMVPAQPGKWREPTGVGTSELN
jgi:DNA modification methylase